MDHSVYIKSSSDASCHDQNNCFTLSQFAANESWLRKDNITVLLLPTSTANHTLDLTLNISDIVNFSMLSNDKSKSFIICQQKVSLDFFGINQIWLRGIWFVGCGLNSFLSVKQLKIEECTFQGRGDSGTAMIIHNSNAIVYKTHFISNRVGFCFVWLNNASTHVYNGGAAVLIQSNAVFLNNKFEGNRAEGGGAIQAHAAYIEIFNNEFIQNYVTTIKRTVQCLGPVINADQCRDGAIHVFYSMLFIDNSIFYNNTHWYGLGGAMHWHYRIKSNDCQQSICE